MSKILTFIRQNRLYVVLFLLICGLNIFAFWGERAGRVETGSGTAVQGEGPREGSFRPVKKLFDEEDSKNRREKLKALIAENPSLAVFMGFFNLTVLFVIFVGLILDIYFIMRWLRGKPLKLWKFKGEYPRWGIGDVVRVMLIFVSFGYLFAILQTCAAQYLPVFYTENFRMISNAVLMNVTGISIVLYFVLKKYGQKMSAVGLVFRKASGDAFYAVVGYVALIPVLMGVMLITFFVIKWFGFQPPVQPIVQVFIEEKTTLVLWLSVLFAAIFGPVAEEIFFRGFMYTAVREKLGVFRAMLITSVIFSFLHTHIVGFVPIVVLGLLLAYLYEKTGSLVASITVHILHNVGMVFLIFLMKYIGA